MAIEKKAASGRPHKLTRAHMEEVIAKGGSVLHNGEILKTIEQLPTEAELSEGDPLAEQAARDSIDAQIAALQAAKLRLDTPPDQREPLPKVAPPIPAAVINMAAVQEAQAASDAAAKSDADKAASRDALLSGGAPAAPADAKPADAKSDKK